MSAAIIHLAQPFAVFLILSFGYVDQLKLCVLMKKSHNLSGRRHPNARNLYFFLSKFSAAYPQTVRRQSQSVSHINSIVT